MSHVVEIIGADGRRRRAKKGETLQDGERFSTPMQFMDAQARELADHLAAKYPPAIRVTDGCGAAAGHRPGFCYDGTRADLRDAADAAYAERTARLSREDPAAARAPSATLDELEQAAAAAYNERSERMRGAWRTHHA